MENEEKDLLEIIFQKHLKFFDTEFILNLLIFYKNKTAISDSTLQQQIDNDKYKFRIVLNEYFFDKFDESFYLFNACKIGNEQIVKYLLKLGVDLLAKNKYNRTPLFYACISGNEPIVRYFVKLGADINNEDMMVKRHYLKHVVVEMNL